MSLPAPLLRHPALCDLYRHWRRHRPGGQLPAGPDFDPVDLRPWCDHMAIIDVADGEFAYAYYGDAFVSAFGSDRVGQSIDVLPPRQRAVLREEYDRASASGIPVSRMYTADFEGRPATWERLVLPLASNGATVDKLLVAAYEIPR
jgi:hypothetical protein